MTEGRGEDGIRRVTEGYFADLAAVTGLSEDEVRRRVTSGGLPLTGEQSAALDERNALREWQHMCEAAERRDFLTALSRVSSGAVASTIIHLAAEMPSPMTSPAPCSRNTGRAPTLPQTRSRRGHGVSRCLKDAPLTASTSRRTGSYRFSSSSPPSGTRHTLRAG